MERLKGSPDAGCQGKRDPSKNMVMILEFPKALSD